MVCPIVSLFSGIGGLDLGLEQAGFGPTIRQVETNEYCNRVLARHWPSAERDINDVQQYATIRPFIGRNGLLCGGFPCQDVSSAGKGAGLKGTRSGLWYTFREAIRHLAPGLVVVENVASGERRWLPHVRRDLHLLGFRTRAIKISAFDCGAPHLRRRVFVLAAHPERFDVRDEPGRSSGTNGTHPAESTDHGAPRPSADDDREGSTQPCGAVCPKWRWSRDSSETALSDPSGEPEREPHLEGGAGQAARPSPVGPGRWTIESPVPGVAHGVPHRVDRERALGNAVVPACAKVAGLVLKEWVGL